MNWYAYGARYYDPVLGRFTGVDPISDEFPWVSTYNYAENTPVNGIDLHGLQLVPVRDLVKKGIRQTNPDLSDEDLNKVMESYDEGSAKGGMIALDMLVDEIPLVGEAKTVIQGGGVVEVILGVAVGGWLLKKAWKAIKKTRRKSGGIYKDLDVMEGEERHHMPANSVSPLSKEKGPSIIMKTKDHKKTASWGSSKSAKAYRKKQKELIDKGEFDKAQKMDIDDVQKKFGNKYNRAIKEMLKKKKNK